MKERRRKEKNSAEKGSEFDTYTDARRKKMGKAQSRKGEKK